MELEFDRGGKSEVKLSACFSLAHADDYVNMIWCMGLVEAAYLADVLPAKPDSITCQDDAAGLDLGEADICHALDCAAALCAALIRGDELYDVGISQRAGCLGDEMQPAVVHVKVQHGDNFTRNRAFSNVKRRLRFSLFIRISHVFSPPYPARTSLPGWQTGRALEILNLGKSIGDDVPNALRIIRANR